VTDRLVADYELESPLPLEKAAAVIAGEQSSGTFVKLPGETEGLVAASGARIESIEETGWSATPSLPCRIESARYTRGRIRLSWPLDNMGTSLTNTLATVAGNLFELAELSALRLLDVEFPEAFRKNYPGPAFGIEGTRRLAGVERGPLIGTIVKPSVGLSPDDTAALALELARGGIDFIKDDELQGNGPHCPLAARVRAVMAVLNGHAEKTGKKVMYAFNITGEIDEMLRNADMVLANGGTCLMVSLHSIGLAGMTAIRKHAELPLHCHRNGWGLFSRSPHIGVSYLAWQKFWRLAGADHLHVNGLSNKFSESDESVIASAIAVTKPLFNQAAYVAMPVFSSGQTALQAEPTFAALGSRDLIYCAGGGIMGHPDRVAGGVASLREAWDAALAGVRLADYANSHPALAAAVQAFGARVR
jgi:ribulose-bisphosphate carboxylase large chain